ncbi:macrophage migration inhibitory factor-like [Patiria miniata]|uniref:D-dopachrome decarboxylase n=1 Tax=Patiria miniata TaxID=46514 RepID=A0A914A6N4_PATMI|nr:macrophage migration inhibitory factor-like [Patiria miniata]
MPLCELNTNVPRAKVDESFVKELSQLVASIVDVPEKGVTLQVNPDQLMMRAGTLDPVVTVAITGFSTKYFTDAMREKWVTSLTTFLSEKLGITDHGRIIMSFHLIEATHVGFFGKLASSQLK